MAAASSVVELCALADAGAGLDAATSAKFFSDNDGAGGAIGSSSWPEAEKTKSKLMSQSALEALCEKYEVPAGYTPTILDGRWVACRTPPEGSNTICLYVDALEAGMRIPLHKFHVALLRHFGLAPSQLAPDAWRSMAAFVLLSKDAGVEPMLQAFLSLFSVCTHDGDSVGWHHFKSRPGPSRCLFSGRMPRSPEWKSRFFFLRSLLPTVKWGKPSRAAVRVPPAVTSDTETVIKKLLDRAGSSGIYVVQFLSRRSMPVAPPQVRFTLTPQQKHKHKHLVGVRAAGAAAWSPQEPTRKRKSSSDTDTRWRGLVDCIAEASECFSEFSELAKKAMTELDATKGEVAQLKEALSVANAQHAAQVSRLADEHHKAITAHAEEMKAEHASVVSELTERLKKEHAAAVSELTERLKKEHAGAVARLNEDHATSVEGLKQKHAADVARVKDAADKEVQDTKKNIALRLFPRLDVTLLERPKLKRDPPKAEGRS